MVQWRSWIWPGLFAISIVTILALWINRAAVEAELSAGLDDIQQENTWVTHLVEGRDVTLSGTAPSEESLKSVVSMAESLHGVRTVKVEADLLPIQSPYLFEIKKDDRKIQLQGFVPNKEISENLVAAAKALENVDSVGSVLKSARGAPDNLAAIAGFMVELTTGLSHGTITLSDSNISISGSANTVAAYEQLIAASPELVPEGSALSVEGLQPATITPYTFTVVKSEGQIILSGHVPEPAMLEKLPERIAVNSDDQLKIENQLKLAVGAPNAFSDLVQFSINQLGSLKSAEIHLVDQRLSVSGEARTVTGQKSVLEAAEKSLPAGSMLENLSILPPSLSPYVFSAEKSAGQITLSGYVPSMEVRETLRQAALKAAPDRTLNDQLELARGENDGFTSLASFGFSQLSQLLSGSFAISDQSYTITGQAETVESYERILNAAHGTLPGGASLGNVELTGPIENPYVWGIEKTRSSIAVFGYVPSSKIKAELLDKVRALTPGLQLKDELELAFGNSGEFHALIDFSLQLLANLASGKIELSDDAVSIRGIANSGTDYRSLLSKLDEPLPGSGKIAAGNIRLPNQSPYELNFSKADNAIKLEGYVPSDDFTNELLATIGSHHPDLKIETELELAAGQPDDFQAIIEFSSKLIGLMPNSSIKISDNSLSVIGNSADVNSYEEIQKTIRNQLPNGVQLTTAEIQLPEVSPFLFQAEKSGNRIVLTGFVPGETVLSALLKNVADSNPDLKISSDLKLAEGAIDGFLALASHGISQLQFLSEGEVTLSDLDVEISGKAVTPAGYMKLSEILSRPLPSGGLLTDIDITPPIVTPYVLEIVKSDTEVTLAGYVPSGETKNRLRTIAKNSVPNITVVDNTQIAFGDPEDFDQIAQYMVTQLVHLKSGTARLNDSQISFEGEARSAASYDDFTKAIEGPLPGSVSIGGLDVVPAKVETYEWTVALSDKRVTLDGHIPDEATRGKLLETVEEAVPGLPVVDKMSIAAGAPDGFLDLVRFAMGLMQHLGAGEISLTGTEVALRGEASTPNSMERAVAIVSGLPEGFEIVEQELIPPVISPYIWSGTYSGTELTLSGHIETDASRQAVLTAAEAIFSSVEIVDEMVLASGASETFGAATNFALGLLSNMASGTIELSDSSLTVGGSVSEIDAYERLLENLENNVPSGVELTENNVSPPLAAPYFLSFTKSGKKLEIEGYMPSPAARTKLYEGLKVANPTLDIANNLKIALGSPEGVDWERASEVMGSLMPDLSNGTIRINEDILTIEGNAATDESYTRLNKAAAGAGDLQLQITRSNILTPIIDPYVWKMVKQDSKFSVTGYAEDKEKIDQYREAIKSRLGVENLNVEMKVGPGTPEGFDDAIELGIGMFERLESGILSLSNKNFQISGEALTGIAANSVRLKVTEELPDGYQGSHDIKVRQIKEKDLVKSDRCQTLLTDTLRDQQILFEANKSVIKSQSFNLLDRLVFVAQQCPKAKVEIAGHTDADGTDVYNQKLSESRAKSVMKYLTRSGVFASRLTAVGYGEEQPIADNETDEGKAKNRRIEFKILANEEG